MRGLVPFLALAILLAGCAGSWDTSATTTASRTTGEPPATTKAPSSTTTTPPPPPPPPPSGSPSFAAVAIRDNAYAPAELTVAAGSRVTWSNRDIVAHTVTSDETGGPLHEELAAGSQYAYTFDQPGTYAYHCEIHPGMAGRIIVE